jgi:hypothetical protein
MIRDNEPWLDRTLRKTFDVVPMLTIPVAIYALLAGFTGQTRGPDLFTEELEQGRWFITLPSGAPWAVSGGDVLAVSALMFLFFELTRGVGASRLAIVHHTLAVLLTLASIGAFLFVETFATTTFLLIALMCTLDMLGGIIMNIANADPGGPDDED